MKKLTSIIVLVLFASTLALAQGKSGSTLQASKTLEICVQENGTWKYFGEIAVWNTGLNDTEGFNIYDCLQYKAPGQSKEPQNISITDACLVDVQGGTVVIPGLTLEENALIFPYEFAYNTPLDLNGTIRNSAQLTITNHSGGRVNGPNPKFTWTGGTPPACTNTSCGCTFTQGYWDNKPGVVWPSPFTRGALFFNSGLTYQQVMDASVAGGNAYMNLAHQYIAAVLNVANGACAPNSVQQMIAQSNAFFTNFASGSSFCASSSPCGPQVTWAGILADYNQGTNAYADNPGHCSE